MHITRLITITYCQSSYNITYQGLVKFTLGSVSQHHTITFGPYPIPVFIPEPDMPILIAFYCMAVLNDDTCIWPPLPPPNRFLVCALHPTVLIQSFQIQVICLLYQGLDANRFWVLCASICGHKGAKCVFLVGTLET